MRLLRIGINRQHVEITTVPVPAWNDAGQILLDGENEMRGLSIALSRVVEEPKLADSIENILRAKDDEEVIARLRDRGIPEDAISEATPKSPSPPILPRVGGPEKIAPPFSGPVSPPAQGPGHANGGATGRGPPFMGIPTRDPLPLGLEPFEIKLKR